jgi:hypothetical protein
MAARVATAFYQQVVSIGQRRTFSSIPSAASAIKNAGRCADCGASLPYSPGRWTEYGSGNFVHDMKALVKTAVVCIPWFGGVALGFHVAKQGTENCPFLNRKQ